MFLLKSVEWCYARGYMVYSGAAKNVVGTFWLLYVNVIVFSNINLCKILLRFLHGEVALMFKHLIMDRRQFGKWADQNIKLQF